MLKSQVSSWKPSCRRVVETCTVQPSSGRLLIAFALAISLFVLGFANNEYNAYAEPTYNCSLSNHCYAKQIWPNPILGAQTSIYVVHLNAGNGFLTNEEWLFENDNNGVFWVEAGYLVNSHVDNGTELWFWADYRPGDQNVNDHYSSTGIYSGDYGNNVNITIQSGTNSLGNTWTVDVFGHSTGIEGTSTNNSMVPNTIQIGEELVGSSGISAPRAIFEYSTWRGTHDNVGVFHYQTNDGSGNQESNPPYGGWYNGNDPKKIPGGQFYACSPTSC